MQKEEFQFLSADKRTQIHAVKWIPDDGEYTAILQITHGMQEHIDRYEEFAGYLNRQGVLVVGNDHLGHGDSVYDASEYGYFTKENPSDALVADMHTLREIIQKQEPEKPYFMLGHSMGSYMLRKYITIHPEALRGVILVGTGSMPDRTMKLGMNICRFLGKVKGWHHKSRLVKKLSYMGPYKQYDLTGADKENSWLSKETAVVEAFYNDPRAGFDFTVNGYYGLMEAVYYDNQPEHIAKIPRRLPIFLVSGDQDPVGDMGVGVKKVYRQYEQAGLYDITWKLYENDRHEILNETDRYNVYEDIYAWMCVRETT